MLHRGQFWRQIKWKTVTWKPNPQCSLYRFRIINFHCPHQNYCHLLLSSLLRRQIRVSPSELLSTRPQRITTTVPILHQLHWSTHQRFPFMLSTPTEPSSKPLKIVTKWSPASSDSHVQIFATFRSTQVSRTSLRAYACIGLCSRATRCTPTACQTLLSAYKVVQLVPWNTFRLGRVPRAVRSSWTRA